MAPANEGTHEERAYYRQNPPDWRGDVVSILKHTSSTACDVAETVRYSSYGVPFGITPGDSDGDGDVDDDDNTGWPGSYAVRCDYDLDGDPGAPGDFTDQNLTIANGGRTLGRGVLIDGKLSRLTEAYLAEAITFNGYRGMRAKLVEEKQSVKDQISAIEEKRGHWFEPAIRFVSAAKQAAILAHAGSETEKREFLRKIGSNHRTQNRRLSFEPRGALKLVANTGAFDHHEKTAPHGGAVFSRECSRGRLKRRGGDSNSRMTYAITAFPVLLLQPLGHLSGSKSGVEQCSEWGRRPPTLGL